MTTLLTKSSDNNLTYIAQEPYPCEGCALWHRCAQTLEECKAFRNYSGSATGKYSESDRGKLMRVPRHLRE